MTTREAMSDLEKPYPAPSPHLPLQEGLGFRLGRLARTLRRRWASDLASIELSPPQAAVVRALEGSPDSALRELARTLASDPMNVKRCVDDLEQRGLVSSGSRAGDRRPRVLSLTDGGRNAAVEVNRLVREQETWLSSALAPDSRRCLEAALDRLENLLGIHPGGWPHDAEASAPQNPETQNPERKL